MTKRLLLFAMFFCITLLIFPQNINVTAYVDNNRVAAGQNFRLIVEVRGQNFSSPATPTLPPMNFTTLGSSRGSSSSISFINGAMTSEKTETFTFSLRGETTGSFRIPPVTVVVDQKEYLTAPIDVTVTEATNQQQQQQQTRPGTQTPSQPQTPRANTAPDGSEMFMLALVDKTNVYKNEMIVVHYKLFTQSQLQNVSLGSEPNFTGFWKEELFQADKIQMQREVYNGMQYNTLLLRSIALFPSREGTLTIPTFELVIDVVIPARSFFDWGSSRQVKVTSRPVNITVNPLPNITLDRNFIGAVGRFSASSAISANQIEAGESLTYRITLSGTGNFNQTTSPILPNIPGVRFLNPETDDVKNRSDSSFSGKRTFIYPVIFQESGNVTIPEIPITWFDSSQRRYFTQTLPAQTVNVTPSTRQTVVTPGSQQTIRMIGKDIQFIVTSLSTKSFKFLYQTYWYWLIVCLLLLTLALHNIYILEANRRQTDTSYRRNREASVLIKKYLREATKFAKQGSIEFYDSAYIGISQFLTDKLSLPRGSTTKVILETLRENSIAEGVAIDLEKLFEHLNFVKFSNADARTMNIKHDLHIVDNMIAQLTNELGKKKTTRGKR